MTGKNKVVHLHRRDPQEALTRLNRITGLQFARWPESLLDHVAADNLQPDADAKAQPTPNSDISCG